jgi:hypothetical protein
MSAPTTIQAHIAYELIVDHDRGVVVTATADRLSGSRPTGASDSSRFSRAVDSAPHRVETRYEAKNVAVESSDKRVADGAAASIDDFGGRSDALGG